MKKEKVEERLPAGWQINKEGHLVYHFFDFEVDEWEKNERFLLIITILNWLNVILFLFFIIPAILENHL